MSATTSKTIARVKRASESMTAGIMGWSRAVAVLEARRATDVSPAIWQWTAQGTARATARRRDVGHPLLLRTAWAVVALLALGLPSRVDAQTAETPDFTIEYHHADLSGNIRLTTDEYGAVVREAIHLPFGERDTGECGTPEDGARPLGFQGKPRDPKTCLDDFGARDYRAAIGRFQTVDPVLPVDRALRDPQQWNRYAYARNNPLIYTDPDGREIAVIHGGRLYGGGFSGQTVNTTTYGVVTPVHGLGAVAAGSTVVAAGRTFIAGVMSGGLTKLVPWLSGPQGQEAMTTAAEVLTGQELGPGGVPAGRVGAATSEMALVRMGDRLTTVNDVLRNPNLLAGKGPAEIQAILGKSPGWQIETLGKGSHAGQGWVLREYTAAGNPTGRMLRWHPGGGHHGPNPYWRVTGGSDGKSGIIPGAAEP